MNPTGVREVVETYNRLLPPAARRRSPLSQVDAKVAVTFLRWCVEHEVHDPCLWIWMRFRFLRRGYPAFRSLASTKLLDQYGRLAASKEREQVVTARGEGAEIRALIDVAPAHEAIRSRYAVRRRSDLCLAQPSMSGGYHPYSAYCPACDVAYTCAERLRASAGFDVVALRLGRLEGLPQRVIAAVG